MNATVAIENIHYTIARVEARQGQDIAYPLRRLKTPQEWRGHNAVYVLRVCANIIMS